MIPSKDKVKEALLVFDAQRRYCPNFLNTEVKLLIDLASAYLKEVECQHRKAGRHMVCMKCGKLVDESRYVDGEMSKTITKSPCCSMWQRGVDAIRVDATNMHSPQEVRVAKVLEELLKWQAGKYCPTCGAKL